MSVLQQLIYPNTEHDFFSEYFEKKPLLITRSSENKYKHLFDLQRLESLLFKARPWEVSNSWHDSGLMVAKNDDIPQSIEIKNINHLLELYNDGHSITLRKIQCRSSEINGFIQNLSTKFNAKPECNVYFTPKNANGFKAHYDAQDAFFIQTEGSKTWRLWNTETVSLPFLEPFNSNENIESSSSDDFYEITLNAGDVLYVPRGFMHEGITKEQHSIHLSIALYSETNYQLSQALILSAAMQSDSLRKTVPKDVLKEIIETNNLEAIKEVWLKATPNLNPDTAKHLVNFFQQNS